jgi:hypothetical protein
MKFTRYIRKEEEIEGMQEEEYRDCMAVAKHFMSLPNLDMQVVSQATGMSVEVLEKLRENFKKY